MATIYVVDDRPFNRYYLVTLLQHFGHELQSADDGLAALALVEERRPDLIILDVVMPGMDGCDFVRRLRDHPQRADIPVIFYTTSSTDLDARRVANSCGVKWLLTKPSDPQRILQTVASALGERQTPSLAGAAAGDEPSPTAGDPTAWTISKSGLPGGGEQTAAELKLIQLQALTLRLMTLVELGQATQRVRDPFALVDLYCQSAQDIVASRYAAIGIFADDGGYRLLSTRGVPNVEPLAWGWPPAPDGALGRAVGGRRPVRLNDAADAQRPAGLPDQHPPISTLLAVPLVSPDRCLGWFYLADRLGPDGFTIDDERVAVAMAAQLSLSLENSELSEWRRIDSHRLQQEIAERRLIEAESRRNSELIRLAFDEAPVGVCIVDGNGRFLQVNRRLCEQLGYGEKELLDSSFFLLVHPDDLDAAQALFGKLMSAQVTTVDLQKRCLRRNGVAAWFQVRATLIRGGAGAHAIMHVVDVDERERAAEALRLSEEQLRHAQKLEAIGELAGGVAHDLNNILSALVGYADLALDQLPEHAAVRDCIYEILLACDRGTVLTQSLLAFSRKQKVDLAVIELNEVIASFDKFLGRLIREDIRLETVPTAEPLHVLADRLQIEQVLMNLVTNARDAIHGSGRIVIETARVALDQLFLATRGFGTVGDYALFTVTDDGTGMDRETAARIFEPFFTTKDQGKGTGLGLAMAYGIVKTHQGFIDAVSEPGRGTVFQVYLPLAAAPPAAPPAPEPVLLDASQLEATVLVGEDDDALRKLSAKVLRHHGYRVIEAVDGQDAVEKFAEARGEIDLVILDAIMPRKNGKAAYLEMSALTPGLKTIFLSGYASDVFSGDEEFGAEAVFLAKPVSPKELAARVRELLGG